MKLRQVLLESELSRLKRQYSVDTETLDYHIGKYFEEFGETDFIKEVIRVKSEK